MGWYLLSTGSMKMDQTKQNSTRSQPASSETEAAMSVIVWTQHPGQQGTLQHSVPHPSSGMLTMTECNILKASQRLKPQPWPRECQSWSSGHGANTVLARQLLMPSRSRALCSCKVRSAALSCHLRSAMETYQSTVAMYVYPNSDPINQKLMNNAKFFINQEIMIQQWFTVHITG
jgi:hypothetical protein